MYPSPPLGAGLRGPAAYSRAARSISRWLQRHGSPRRLGALFALAVASASWGATPPDTVITNTVTARYLIYGLPATATATAIVTTESHTSSTLQFLQYQPASGPGGSPTAVPAAECSTSGSPAGPFVPLPGPVPSGSSTPLTVPGTYSLAPAALYDAGAPVFVEVTDYDQNLDPNKAETVNVTLTTSNGDHEVLRLTETGLSTGVFIGYIQSVAGAPHPGDCKLSVTDNTVVSAQYSDPSDPSDTHSVQALIDPLGVVFDSLTGKPVNAATVTLLDAASGQPLPAFCADGVTPYPSSVVTGSSFAACGTTVQLPPGGYQFPAVHPGSYRLRLTPPSGYHFPSTVATAALQQLPGAPFAIVPGSRGEVFVQSAGPLTRVDVPLDPTEGKLQLVKTAGAAAVSPGDFVPYTITVRNLDTGMPAQGVQISDQLPPGFRYRAGSARLNGMPMAAPVVSADGSTLLFNLGNIAAGATVTLRYVVSVAPNARPGPAENVASAVLPVASNSARAIVLVREDLFNERAILMGRVLVGECDAPDPAGFPNGRIVMEDGRYALTDSNGNWHLDNIRPGTHVVQLDRDSLPKEWHSVDCANDTQSAGRSFSRFVNVRGGSLWRADFHVVGPFGALTPIPGATSGAAAAPPPQKPVEPTLVEKLPFDKAWLASAQPGREWLHPQENFQPALPAIKVAIQHLPHDTIELRINGERVGGANYDGTLENGAGTVSLSTWSGIHIREGDNRMEVTIRDPDGAVVKSEQRNIHYNDAPVRAELVPALSHLEADGKTRPVIAVRFHDSSGWPARRGLIGEFDLAEPYQAWDRIAAVSQAPLAGRTDGRARFSVGADGVALIELAPTTKVGEVVMKFEFRGGRRQELRTWLKPAARDWILVGFAEGTLGARELSGNMQALRDADADDTLFDGDRVAFYAKGQIRGDYLLTVAYDSAKNRGNSQPDTLGQAIDPNQYYTLYGDASDPQFDAASTRKLYLRIERAQFYALFGDYDTGLTVTELARYSRTVNGFKSELRTDKAGYNVFATSTAQSYVKDELPGDGTSGPYRLSQANIVINSDKVRLETRDRFHSEVIVATTTLTSYLDYDIDYILGTIFLRQPVPVHDEQFNPVYVIVEYETIASTDQRLTYGGRVSYRPIAGTEVGTTHIHEGNVGASGDLTGVDVQSAIGAHTVLKGEVAYSDRSVAGLDANGAAWKAEVTHVDDKLSARVYAREEQEGFGLGQQSATETGTEKIGGEARYKVADDVQLLGETYRQDTLVTGAQRDFLQALAEYHHGPLTTRAGVLLDHDEIEGVDTSSHQLLAGVAYQFLNQRLTLKGDAAVSVSGEASSVDFPDRYRVGADYKLNAESSVFVEHESARGADLSADLTRVGVRTQLWTGAELASAIGDEAATDGSRLFSSLGLVQRWQVNRHWQLDFALDRTATLKDRDATPLNPSVPLTSGSPEGDYTTVAIGANYTAGAWSGNTRIEWRNAQVDARRNALLALQYRIDAQRTLALGVIYSDSNGGGAAAAELPGGLGSGSGFAPTSPFGASGGVGTPVGYGAGSDSSALNPYGLNTAAPLKDRRLDGRLGYAWRPNDSRWIWLDRFDVISESADILGGPSSTHKLVNNLNTNFAPEPATQLSLELGAKYAFDTIDGSGYRGFTDLIGIEVRHDLNANWDIGADASLMHVQSAHSCDYGLGASVGRRLATNVWMAVGYNLLGFKDYDFSGASYRARGVYLTIRAKVDEDTFGLNRRHAAATP